jgi:hypothetical protein
MEESEMRTWSAIGILAIVLLAACGGGGGTTSTNDPGGTEATSTGVASGVVTPSANTLIMNGTEFLLDKVRQVEIDDDTSLRPQDIEAGMVARVEFEKDPATGLRHALRIRASSVVRGIAGTIPVGATSFVLVGQVVTVDDNTFFLNTAATAKDLSPLGGKNLRVFGIFTSPETILATLIQVLPDMSPQSIQVRGFVSGWDTADNTFRLGVLTVDYDSFPLPAGFDNGVFVEVQGAVFQKDTMTLSGVTRIRIETVPPPPTHLEVTLKGGVADLDLAKGAFTLVSLLGKVPVVYTSGTAFVGGEADNLAIPGVRVEVHGTLEGGTLSADRIQLQLPSVDPPPVNFLQRRVTLQGQVSAVTPESNTITVLGIVVDTSKSLMVGFPAAGDNVLVVGVSSEGPSAVKAILVLKVSSQAVFLLGTVEDFTHVAGTSSGTVNILGVTISTGASTEYRIRKFLFGSRAVSVDAFFDSLRKGETIVKAAADGGSFAVPARKMEIEPELGLP